MEVLNLLCKLKLFCVGGSEEHNVTKDEDNEQLPPYINTEDDKNKIS